MLRFDPGIRIGVPLGIVKPALTRLYCTVSVAVLLTLPSAAVIVTVPGVTLVASPWLPLVLLTVATALLEEDHVTVFVRSRVELSEYVPVAWNCTPVPLAIV
jgi:hypothetical protein